MSGRQTSEKMFSSGTLFALWTIIAHSVEADSSCSSTAYTLPNVTWCNWHSPRVNIIRDVLYMDGGYLMSVLAYPGDCKNFNEDDGSHTFSLDLSTSFNTSSNFSAVLTNMSLGTDGSELNLNHIDGTMFANDYDFWLYGGMPEITEGEEASSDEVLGYRAYNDMDAQTWSQGEYIFNLDDNITTFVTNGAGTSAPSENLGFYFSGVHTTGWDQPTWQLANLSETSDKLITVNMTYSVGLTWENDTLPSYVQGRSSAELVWVPVSDNGVLVAIGGVIKNAEIDFPDSYKLSSAATTEGEEVNPTFMETVPVYDIGSKTWYIQNTTGDTPPALANFCAVLASASDGSSHNIYVYGGYDGISDSFLPYDAVYILSLPSFKWVKAYNGTESHGRMGHRCMKVYPDQMLSVGGYRVDSLHCVEGGLITTFNLNNLTFQDEYDPAQWSEYKVPDILTAEIGGDSSGGSTATPTTWTNSSLADVFGTKYTKTITNYYPYNTTSSDTSSSHHHKGLPTWAKAVIGVLVGLFGVALIVLALWFYFRRRQRRIIEKEPGPSEADGTERLTSMYGGGPVSPVAGPTSVSTGQETSAGARTTHTASASISTSNQGTVESGGGPLHEMHDSSPIELPTAFNNTSSTDTTSHNHSSEFSVGRSPSPISPQTPDTESARSLAVTGIATTHRSMSTRSIDNVVAARLSNFRETFDPSTPYHKHQGSEVSEASQVSSSDKAQVGETIHENE